MASNFPVRLKEAACGVGGRARNGTSPKPSWPPAELVSAQGQLGHEHVEQVAAVLQPFCSEVRHLFDTVHDMQGDIEELKGSVQHDVPSSIDQLLIHQRMSMNNMQASMQDSIVNTLQVAMAHNHREMTQLHGQHRELTEAALQKQEGIERQMLQGKEQNRQILGEVRLAATDEEPRGFKLTAATTSGDPLSILFSKDSAAAEHSLVINFRRLLVMISYFELVHELIKSTAVAALTIVAAETSRQGIFTLLFIVLVFLLYARHDRVYDGTDIADVDNLMPLVRNDDHDRDKHHRTNPNKLLKSLSLQRLGGWRFWGCRLVLITIAVVTILGWSSLNCWQLVDVGQDEDEIHELPPGLQELYELSLRVIGGESDAGVLAMQLIILDIMVLLELTFEYFVWRETSMVPTAPSGCTIWDPREHGVPKYWLLGMPSMWFTSQKAKHDLRQYAVFAQFGSDKNADAYDVLPAELARYALQGEASRDELSKALRESKRFDARTQRFVDAQGHPLGKDQAAEPLGITMYFFESQGYHPVDGQPESLKYPGQWQMWEEKQDRLSVRDELKR